MTAVMQEAVRPVRPWAGVFAVAWRRSWAFTNLYRRSTIEARDASKHWTWQWVVVAWQATGQSVLHLISTGLGAGEIWTARSASATVRPVGRRRPVRLDGLVVALCLFLALVTVLLWVETVVVFTWFGVLSSGGAVTVFAVVAAGVLSVLLIGAVVAQLQFGSEGPRRLARRARELTAGPAVVVTAVVAGRRDEGHGLMLMRALQAQWQRDEVVLAILYAGADNLVGYYATKVGGWTLDGDSKRRMTWTPGEHS